jgi:hypothetical protein
MDLVTLLASAAGEAEHNETPFLIVGGALAAFAVIVGIIGLMRPGLGEGANKIIIGVGSVLVVGTMYTIVAVA